MVPTKAEQLEQLDKQMEQRMINAAQGMMNSNMNMGLGSSGQNAAQSALWGNSISGATISNSTIPPGPLVSTQSLQTPKHTRVRVEVSIEQVNNGYVINIGGYPGESYIATTFEDINTIITSELASRMLEKAE